jgi:hypothetical protein
VAIGPFHLTRPRALAREWKGVADLLPRYPAVEDRTVAPTPDGPVRRRPHELDLPWLVGHARAAHAMHAAIEDGWAALRSPPAVFPRIGFGHATPRACVWDGATMTVTKGRPAGPRTGGWEVDEGDGTVPMFCGLPVEMDNYPREDLGVHRRHGPIAEIDDIEPLLAAVAADASLEPYRAADQGDVGLGLDLDELHPAERPMPVAARLVRLGERVDARDAVVWAVGTVVAHADGTPVAAAVPAEVRLEWDGDRREFRGALPGFAPGLVEVRVVARDATDEPAVQVVEVRDDSGLE